MKRNDNLPQVLSPAADLTALKFAITYGADAVYLGGQSFSMRRGGANFTQEQLHEGVQYAHVHDKKVYYTLNTTPTPDETDEIPKAIEAAEIAGVDAFIVADIGVMMMCKLLAPNVAVHMSTQAGVTNELTARALYDLGASRVVLARELSCEQIAAIRAKTPRELSLECFVHGAMCMSFSGRCLISNHMVGRDANKGECFQPCRHSYTIKNDSGYEMQLSQDEGGSYILNAKDLCMAQHLDKLRESGVDCFKIEGRSKSFYYVASVTSCYRRATDALKNEPYDCGDDVKSELLRTSHRPYSTGFYLGTDGATQATDTGGYIRGGEPLAVVERCEDDRVHCTQRGKFITGDTLNLLMPGGESADIKPRDLRDEDGEPITATPHPMQKFSFLCDFEPPPMSILRRC